MAAEMLPFVVAWLDMPTAWYFVGAGLSLATIGLISLLRTRWRQVRAWKKCALLSLWVHILLAYLATVLRIVSGPGAGPGYGPGPPIHVALLSAEEIVPLAVMNEAEEEAPPEEAPDELIDAKPQAEAFEAPDLLPEPEAAAPPEPETIDEAPDKAAVVEEAVEAPPPELEPILELAAETLSKDAESTPSVEAEPSPSLTEASTADVSPSPRADAPSDSPAARPVTSAAPRPAEYADRFDANRAELVAGGGGNANTERAVRAALAWLAAAQSEDGRWNARRHGAGQERYVLGHDRGGAGAKADTGVSGLALLAFLGAGHSHRDGDYEAEIARGLDFLRRSQRSSGSLQGDAELFAQTYCHSMAAFAVCEAYAMTKDQRLEPIARAATSHSLAVQHPTDGGWRYRPGDTGDTSQLGWQVMALKSAELGGLAVPEATWTRVDRFLRQVERGSAGGLAAYRPEGPPTRPMTAEALYCRQLVTGRIDGQLSQTAVNEAIDSLLKEPPTAGAINLYYWYYATLALHRVQHHSPVAADAWRRWNDALTRTLLATQREDGSWPETCLWGGYGGRVFTTALGAMCLEVYYRYAPTAQQGVPVVGEDIARRTGWQSAPAR